MPWITDGQNVNSTINAFGQSTGSNSSAPAYNRRPSAPYQTSTPVYNRQFDKQPSAPTFDRRPEFDRQTAYEPRLSERARAPEPRSVVVLGIGQEDDGCGSAEGWGWALLVVFIVIVVVISVIGGTCYSSSSCGGGGMLGCRAPLDGSGASNETEDDSDGKKPVLTIIHHNGGIVQTFDRAHPVNQNYNGIVAEPIKGLTFGSGNQTTSPDAPCPTCL